MSNRPIRRGAVLVSVLAVTLAACSDDGQPSPDATDEPTTEASTPELTVIADHTIDSVELDENDEPLRARRRHAWT